jgi:hypothetical protein
VINWGDKASRGKAEQTEGPDEVGEAACEDRPDEVRKSPAKPAKGFLIGLQTAENFRQSYLAGGILKGRNFHSIVIVGPLHVSKFYRVLKKLTA